MLNCGLLSSESPNTLLNCFLWTGIHICKLNSLIFALVLVSLGKESANLHCVLFDL